MNDLQLIEAVKARNIARATELIESGININQEDEQGWTALNWAAGKGDIALVKLLVEKGADVFKVGRDQRTPNRIALAAGHADVVRFLRQAEEDAGGSPRSNTDRIYCKAYRLSDLRLFPGWVETAKPQAENNGAGSEDADPVVFLHQDFSVTKSMWHNENVLYDNRSPAWEKFCKEELKFQVPDDLDFIISAEKASGQGGS